MQAHTPDTRQNTGCKYRKFLLSNCPASKKLTVFSAIKFLHRATDYPAVFFSAAFCQVWWYRLPRKHTGEYASTTLQLLWRPRRTACPRSLRWQYSTLEAASRRTLHTVRCAMKLCVTPALSSITLRIFPLVLMSKKPRGMCTMRRTDSFLMLDSTRKAARCDDMRAAK